MRGSTFTEIHVLKAANEPAKFFIEPMLTGVSHTNCTVDEIADPTDIAFGSKVKSGFIAMHVDNGVGFILEGAAIDGKTLNVRGWAEQRVFGAQGVPLLRARIYIRSQAGSGALRDVSGNGPVVATLEMPLPSKSGCAEIGLLESERIPQARVCW